MSDSSETQAICGARASECRCGLPPGHEGPHVCADTARCSGSWTGTFDRDDFNDGQSVLTFAERPMAPAGWEYDATEILARMTAGPLGFIDGLSRLGLLDSSGVEL